MITRNQYLNRKATHDDYYRQFVNGPIIYLVGQEFGDLIFKSEDPFFNDIPLQRWDSISPTIAVLMEASMLKKAGETWSLSTSICIAKAAAKMIKEEFDKNN